MFKHCLCYSATLLSVTQEENPQHYGKCSQCCAIQFFVVYFVLSGSMWPERPSSCPQLQSHNVSAVQHRQHHLCPWFQCLPFFYQWKRWESTWGTKRSLQVFKFHPTKPDLLYKHTTEQIFVLLQKVNNNVKSFKECSFFLFTFF